MARLCLDCGQIVARFHLIVTKSWLYWGNIVAIMFKAKPRLRNLVDARPINTSFTVTDTSTSVDAVTFTKCCCCFCYFLIATKIVT